ncbi:NAF1-domain-containing protein [Pluteus cervinus]|uniref:NAF1-domain-containing protein n=1 Tax=Pluteus cervinus TaxID=181527 RepID=A0ACD3BI96_9AGAR|nr:NAF1-domain-containing protein [Pluteus cervinus]
MDTGFKPPHAIPQDLLLIYDILGPQAVSAPHPVTVQEDDIESSDSENGSEDEIEAELKIGSGDEISPGDSTDSPDTTSDENDSSDEDEDSMPTGLQVANQDDDEDPVPSATNGAYFLTKNEVSDTEIRWPEIQEVGPGETLEKVGEITTIVDRVVIVKGTPSHVSNVANQRALDSDTLLVFPDRRVLGYVYETFGPTSQPLYQVRFPKDHQIDLDKVKIGLEVFHVPERSRFVFLSQIKHFKGSDASNVYDEEPGDDELEFSDDEAEAAYKRGFKQKRAGSRASSVASSRRDTPSRSLGPETHPDAFSGNAYDAHSPYDLDYGAGPSRPTPIPYDDPYAETYVPESPEAPSSPQKIADDSMGRGQDYPTRGRGGNQRRPFGRDRGRARGRGQFPPFRGGRRSRHNSASSEVHSPLPMDTSYVEPTTEQFFQPPAYPAQVPGFWNPIQQPSYPMMVQPHINPRFFSNFAPNMGGVQPQSFFQVPQYTPPPYDPVQSFNITPTSSSGVHDDQTHEWTVPNNDNS